MTRYAASTEVSVEKSKAEIERILTRYGASSFGYATEGARALVQFKAKDRYVRFILPLPQLSDKAIKFVKLNQSQWSGIRTESQQKVALEQATRSRWRALALIIKSKLEAVESEITTFEDEFLAHTVLPNGETVSSFIQPQIDEAYRSGMMPSSILALPAPRKDAE